VKGIQLVTTTCIDLRQRFGNRFQVRNELEACRAHVADDPWDLVIQGRTGFVAPWGGDTLVACTRHVLTTRRIIEAVPGSVVVQDGQDGQNVTFDTVHFDTVAAILGLRKRRRLSEAHRKRLVEQVASFRFAGPSDKSGPLRAQDGRFSPRPASGPP
jgi:hypothetical protein